MSLMPFKGRCIHCGHDHGNSDFYGDDPIRYQERLKAQAMLEKVAVHVLEKQIATLTRQRDLAVEAIRHCIAAMGSVTDVKKAEHWPQLHNAQMLALQALHAIKESEEN